MGNLRVPSFAQALNNLKLQFQKGRLFLMIALRQILRKVKLYSLPIIVGYIQNVEKMLWVVYLRRNLRRKMTSLRSSPRARILMDWRWCQNEGKTMRYQKLPLLTTVFEQWCKVGNL